MQPPDKKVQLVWPTIDFMVYKYDIKDSGIVFETTSLATMLFEVLRYANPTADLLVSCTS